MNMKVSKCLDSIAAVLISPNQSEKNGVSKPLAWAITIIVGLGTVGLAQGAAALWRMCRPAEQSKQVKKVQSVFSDHIPSQDKTDTPKQHRPSSVQPQKDPLKDPVLPKEPFLVAESKIANEKKPAKQVKLGQIKAGQIPDEKAEISFEDVANQIYQQRMQIVRKIVGELGPGSIKEKLKPLILNHLISLFQEKGYSLQELDKNSEWIDLFLQDPFLRPALITYAQQQGLENIKNRHLLHLSKSIYANRADFFDNNLANIFKNGDKDAAINSLRQSLDKIRDFFHQEGRSLSQVLQNKEDALVFMQSERLKLILTLYVQLLEQSNSSSPPAQKQEVDLDQARKKEIVDLAKKGLCSPGLVTNLGLNEISKDAEAMRRELRRLARENHPDKIGVAGKEKMQEINQLIDLLKDPRDYHLYRKLIQNIRDQS